MNWIPGVSQLKSAIQAMTLDFEGAKKTQKDFLQQCPVVSQVTSVAQVIAGDKEGAIETQRKCLGTVNTVVNSIPIVGHTKGLVHSAFGDEEGAAIAFKSSNRSVGVVAGGVGGFLVGGPVGAVAGGISGGMAMDTVHTVVDEEPNGLFATVEQIKKDDHPAGAIFDLAAGVVLDGLSANAVVQPAGSTKEGKRGSNDEQIENKDPNSVNNQSSPDKEDRLRRKMAELDEKCELGLDKQVLEGISTLLIESSRKERFEPILVELKTTPKEREAISFKLDAWHSGSTKSLFKPTKVFTNCSDQDFRLEQSFGPNKDEICWDIQRNAVKGQASLAQAITWDGVQILINALPPGAVREELQDKHGKLLCRKLKSSLNSFNEERMEINASSLTISELLEILDELVDKFSHLKN